MNIQRLSNNNHNTFKIGIVIKNSSLKVDSLIKYYAQPIIDQCRGLTLDDFIAVGVAYDSGSKVSVKTIKAELDNLERMFKHIKIESLLVVDGNYFKKITNERKAEVHLGYRKEAVYNQWGIPTFLNSSYTVLMYDNKTQEKIDLCNGAIADHFLNKYQDPGASIIHKAWYPDTVADIGKALSEVMNWDAVTIDIEAFSLKVFNAGIGTITFCKNKHEGIAFPVKRNEGFTDQDVATIYVMLLSFFENYPGEKIFHNVGYDVKILIWELFMQHPQDRAGMFKGIDTMCRNLTDTQLYTYLATNSTSRPQIGLKPNAHEFAGNYAVEEINDITQIPLPELLQYNLVDGLSTWYVHDKYKPVVIADNQWGIYETILRPSVEVFLQMELTGVPMSMDAIKNAEKTLKDELNQHVAYLSMLALVTDCTELLRKRQIEKDNLTLKTKKRTMDDPIIQRIEFSYTSNPNVATLLHDVMKLPIIDLTPEGQPSVGSKTLKKLKNHTVNSGQTKVLDTLIAINEITILLNTFINAFYENTFQHPDGTWWLYGNYKQGGTVSGRISSNNPNLMNMPSTGTRFAKLIKSCFQAPDGWLMVGADFASLEDRISALTTKDPNKLKVYTDGYDGHCFRAYGYWPDRMPDIQLTVSSINSIKKKYPNLRQDSKEPTFLLTYGGTYHGLMNNVGMSEEEAKLVEKKYHELYAASDRWVEQKIAQASKDGYGTVAFGLRVRTNLLQKTLMNSSKVPYEAKKEARTLGNALGQSYGMLNNRAAIEFNQRTKKDDMRHKVLPIMHIHDAQYFIIENDIYVVEWTNNNLIPCMEWQDLPEIYHPDVKLGGDLSIFYPGWDTEYEIPNYCDQKTIREKCKPEE